MALSAAERQRRCREKRRLNPEIVAEVKHKDLESYHARKKDEDGDVRMIFCKSVDDTGKLFKLVESDIRCDV